MGILNYRDNRVLACGSDCKEASSGVSSGLEASCKAVLTDSRPSYRTNCYLVLLHTFEFHCRLVEVP